MRITLSYLIVVCIILLSSCRKPEPEPHNYENGTNEYVNNWIYDNMNFYYYWTDDIPDKNINGENPDNFFYGLLSKQDRFSWIQPNFQELLNSLQGITLEAGYEFTLYEDTTRTNGVLGQIAYIKQESPSEDAGLKRGDLFKKINGVALTLDNYNNLLENIRQNHSLTIERFDFENGNFVEIGKFDLSAIQFAENPNHLDTVYTRNSKKIGYYVYNQFVVGIGNDGDSALYAEQMDEIFARFKSEGIDHLVLDLRYNSGGAERATINLASLIGANITEQNIFVKRDYNEGLKQAFINEYGEEFLNKKFVTKEENIGNRLISPQLTILTSTRTASASELLINGLDPFMETYIIGDTTVGKNVGSTSFYEEDNLENTWGIQPIITKSFNSLNQSDYDLGFYPNQPLKDNDLVKFQLGDVNEKLLREALIYLAGSDEVSRIKSYKSIPSKDIMSSIELKRIFGIYDIDLDH